MEAVGLMAQPTEAAVEIYAGWGRRLAAWLIDQFVYLIALLAPLPLFASTSFAGSVPANIAYSFWLLLFPTAYATVGNGSGRGQTIGKRAVGVSVRRHASLGRLGYGRALGRSLTSTFLWVLLVVPGLLDVLWPLWDRRHQAIHDKVAGSVVIRL